MFKLFGIFTLAISLISCGSSSSSDDSESATTQEQLSGSNIDSNLDSGSNVTPGTEIANDVMGSYLGIGNIIPAGPAVSVDSVSDGLVLAIPLDNCVEESEYTNLVILFSTETTIGLIPRSEIDLNNCVASFHPAKPGTYQPAMVPQEFASAAREELLDDAVKPDLTAFGIADFQQPTGLYTWDDAAAIAPPEGYHMATVGELIVLATETDYLGKWAPSDESVYKIAWAVEPVEPGVHMAVYMDVGLSTTDDDFIPHWLIWIKSL